MKVWAWATLIFNLLWLSACGMAGATTGGEGSEVAGDVAGNGGDIVICQERSKVTYRMLDLYEGMKAQPPLNPDLATASYKVLEKVNYALDRLGRLDPARAAYYRGHANKFLSEVEWISSGKPLDDVPDSGYVKLPPQCHLAQIAIRRPTFHQSIKPFLVDKRLWDAPEFDDDQKAGLILHEAVYGELIQLGHKNSINARLFNRFLCSNAFEHMSDQEYATLTQKVFTFVAKLEFVKEKFDFDAVAGVESTIDLPSLLKAKIPGALSWMVLPDLEWIDLDKKKEIVTINPPLSAAGTTVSVSVIVRQNDGGAISQLNIQVKSP
jgi:hypothetical protein